MYAPLWLLIVYLSLLFFSFYIYLYLCVYVDNTYTHFWPEISSEKNKLIPAFLSALAF